MRVTAGELRGRRLNVPDLPGLRPTPSKVRQALFNILGDIDGMTMLELFSGSGVMAVEALSRGAASVLSIERNPKAVQQLKRLRQTLDLNHRWQIKQAEVSKGLATLAGQRFDLIFADPPYEQGFSESLPALLSWHGIGCQTMVMEESARITPAWPEGWHCRQSRRYGDSCLHFLEPSS